MLLSSFFVSMRMKSHRKFCDGTPPFRSKRPNEAGCEPE